MDLFAKAEEEGQSYKDIAMLNQMVRFPLPLVRNIHLIYNRLSVTYSNEAPSHEQRIKTVHIRYLLGV